MTVPMAEFDRDTSPLEASSNSSIRFEIPSPDGKFYTSSEDTSPWNPFQPRLKHGLSSTEPASHSKSKGILGCDSSKPMSKNECSSADSAYCTMSEQTVHSNSPKQTSKAPYRSAEAESLRQTLYLKFLDSFGETDRSQSAPQEINGFNGVQPCDPSSCQISAELFHSSLGPGEAEDALESHRYLVAQAKRRAIDDLMEELSSSIFSASPRRIRSHTATSGTSSSCENSATSLKASDSVDLSAVSASSVRAGKRRADDSDLFSNDDDEGDLGRRKRPKKSYSQWYQPLKPRLFACPFHKYSQRTYSSSNEAPDMAQKFRVCGGPGWPTIARLKEHLYRVHQAPIHCTRCWTPMATELELQQHARADMPCIIQPPVLHWVSRDKVDLLKDRKRITSCQTEEERWKGVFRLLFPGESDLPSPYYDDLDQTIPDEIPQSPSSSSIAAFERYSKENLPRKVHEELERLVDEQMQPIEESLRRALTDVVRNCQEQIFRDWMQQNSQRPMESIVVECRGAFDSTVMGGRIVPTDVPPAFYIEPTPAADDNQFNTLCELPKAHNDSSTGGADSGYESLAPVPQSPGYEVSTAPTPGPSGSRAALPFEELEGFDFEDSSARLPDIPGTEYLDWSAFFGEKNDGA